MSSSLQMRPLDEDETADLPSLRANKYGNLIPLWCDGQGNPRFMLGPHYPLFFTAFVVCTALICFLLFNYMEKFSIFWKVVTSLSAGGFIFSYLRIGFSLPGVELPRRELRDRDRQSVNFCEICGIVRDRRTQHCGDCDVCISGYDHHCPWVGKCVGKDNLTAFYTFLVMTFSNLVICFVAISTVNIAGKHLQVEKLM